MTNKRRKPEDPEKPVYEFPVAFTWGPSVIKTHKTEQERYALAMEAFRTFTEQKVDIVVRVQFFDFQFVRYRLISSGSYQDDEIPHLWCDINDDFEESLFGDLSNGSIKKAN